ncbi:MAG: phosphate signaling complex protein PhoU [Ignavibacteriales bacterium]|nr:phosphate signaling complex protein PhoU [Ignavibacteriales bacterium]MBK7981644.1 phosphate signaling complex protein PhoU [Ignavibacteriota bacterium]
MERQFEIHLGKLRTRIIKMSSLVEDQMELAIRSINEENLELTNLIIEREDKINKLDRKIEKTCQKIIALSQPVAIDLRLVLSALTINTNLERLGDLAKNIARSFQNLKKKPLFLNRTKHHEMTIIVKKMIKDAIDSFNNNDAELAKKVIESDVILDNLFAENRKILISIMKENSANIDEALSLLEISRHFERAGDHSTNIAEDVYFIVEAQLIKHKYEKYIYSEIEEDEEEDN